MSALMNIFQQILCEWYYCYFMKTRTCAIFYSNRFYSGQINVRISARLQNETTAWYVPFCVFSDSLVSGGICRPPERPEIRVPSRRVRGQGAVPRIDSERRPPSRYVLLLFIDNVGLQNTPVDVIFENVFPAATYVICSRVLQRVWPQMLPAGHPCCREEWSVACKFIHFFFLGTSILWPWANAIGPMRWGQETYNNSSGASMAGRWPSPISNHFLSSYLPPHRLLFIIIDVFVLIARCFTDGCALADGPGLTKGKALLASRGGCSFIDKAEAAAAAGAVEDSSDSKGDGVTALIIANDETSLFHMGASPR